MREARRCPCSSGRTTPLGSHLGSFAAVGPVCREQHTCRESAYQRTLVLSSNQAIIFLVLRGPRANTEAPFRGESPRTGERRNRVMPRMSSVPPMKVLQKKTPGCMHCRTLRYQPSATLKCPGKASNKNTRTKSKKKLHLSRQTSMATFLSEEKPSNSPVTYKRKERKLTQTWNSYTPSRIRAVERITSNDLPADIPSNYNITAVDDGNTISVEVENICPRTSPSTPESMMTTLTKPLASMVVVLIRVSRVTAPIST